MANAPDQYFQCQLNLMPSAHYWWSLHHKQLLTHISKGPCLFPSPQLSFREESNQEMQHSQEVRNKECLSCLATGCGRVGWGCDQAGFS